MDKIKKNPVIRGMAMLAGGVFLAGLLGVCEPEIGSEAWCEALKEKPKGDWTANEAGDFAKHCVL